MMPLNRPALRQFAVVFPARIRPDRFTLLAVGAAALGVFIVLAREFTYGVAISWDSITYISVSWNLLEGDGFSNYRGMPHTTKASLYPLLLAVVSLGMFELRDVAGPLNAVIFGMTIFVVGQYLRRRLESRALAAWGCIAVALSVPLAESAAWALTGSLFILLTTLALIQADNFLFGGKVSSLVWAAVFCALAWHTRYIGVTAMASVGLLLLLQPGASPAQRLRRVAGFSLIASLPVALWLVRNYLALGELTGSRRMVDYSLPSIIGDLADGLWRWTHFNWDAAQGPALALLAILAAVLIPAGRVFIRAQWGQRPTGDWRPCRIFGGFALVYAGLLVTALMLGNSSHGLEHRYLAPLYIPLLITAVYAADRLLGYARERKLPGYVGGMPGAGVFAMPRWLPGLGVLTAVLIVALFLWAGGQAAAGARQVIKANSGELYMGYSSPRWAGSETLQYLRENPVAGKLRTNERAVVYLHRDTAGIICGIPSNSRSRPVLDDETAAKWDLPCRLPPPALVDAADPAAGRRQLAEWLSYADDEAYVVWFMDSERNRDYYPYGAAALRTSPGLEPVAELSDGAIFRVNKSYTPTSNPYQAAYQAIVSGEYGEPAARSTFDVYRTETALTYIKEQCAPADVAAKFMLHVFPADLDNLPDHRRRHGFDNLSFRFADYGLIWDGKCVAIAPLPEYEITAIRTGQNVSGEGELWRADLAPIASP